jgi:hypothetical protein
MRTHFATIAASLLLLIIGSPAKANAQEECEECFSDAVACSYVNQNPGLFGTDVRTYCASHPSANPDIHFFGSGQECEGSSPDCYECGDDCHILWEMNTCSESHNVCAVLFAATVRDLEDAVRQGDLETVLQLVRADIGIQISPSYGGILLVAGCGEAMVAAGESVLTRVLIATTADAL